MQIEILNEICLSDQNSDENNHILRYLEACDIVQRIKQKLNIVFRFHILQIVLKIS